MSKHYLEIYSEENIKKGHKRMKNDEFNDKLSGVTLVEIMVVVIYMTVLLSMIKPC